LYEGKHRRNNPAAAPGGELVLFAQGGQGVVVKPAIA